jgi:hypothetical protein
MVDLDHHLLAARQEIVFGKGVAMGDLIELVAARDVLHCPVRLGRFCEGDPRRHDIGGTEAPIGRVLVPRHEGRIGRLLDEEVGGPAQQIRAVKILDRVQDGAAPHELGEPGKQQVRFMAHIALERRAGAPLERLEPPSEVRRLRLGHDADREDAALLPILFDLGRCQTLRHRSSQ